MKAILKYARFFREYEEEYDSVSDAIRMAWAGSENGDHYALEIRDETGRVVWHHRAEESIDDLYERMKNDTP